MYCSDRENFFKEITTYSPRLVYFYLQNERYYSYPLGVTFSILFVTINIL
ncbi:Hypothetical protein ETEE_3799 [Edwardsiella anguillarum ET080813]|uniref:Uncharacterized protein n=1 Tax=Edwardsiella anguillarum ET080813 TaxID=667120 RepID=A0A076LQG0_9GAMM|nr:Hypothetical protein ETEE_3799 [Edwardsiella anguillarum ET080813]